MAQRLIDANSEELKFGMKLLREGEQQIYGKNSWGFATKYSRLIEEAPTVDAIPIEWLINYSKNGYELAFIERMLKDWRKGNE